MNILVLAGGLSMERDVSLSSGSLIANALVSKGHNVALADLYFGVKKEDIRFYNDRYYDHKVKETVPDLCEIIKQNGGRDEPVGENIIEFCKRADVTFLALHGGVGENGKLQSLLEMNGIKFTGSSSVGCMIAMDKMLSKELVSKAGILTADWLTNKNDMTELERLIPCFVKPADNGSSVGVTKVTDVSKMDAAIKEAEKYSGTVLVEKQVCGREVSVGILGGRALPPIEIITGNNEFYDYKTKYQSGYVKEVCPAELPSSTCSKVMEAAEAAHNALRLGSYSRIDFIITENGEPFFLEANALPGMTPTSLFPQEAAAVGIPYPDLCMKIIELSK